MSNDRPTIIGLQNATKLTKEWMEERPGE